MMHLELWKLVLLIMCVCQVRGNEYKPEKLSDFKAKLAKTVKAPPASADLIFEKNVSISELGIDLPPGMANDTVEFDHHTYYNSTFYSDPEVGKKFWIDINSYPQPIVHHMLSDSHRQATTIPLKFDFPFYGSLLKNVTIATGGFLYTGDYLHNWIAATQYIAPLMANFDSSQSNDSFIKYADNGTAFTAEWSQVYIKDRINDGAFTFQVTLFTSGDILFAYKEVPYSISNISDASHPVKIGISDAYVLERSLFFVRRKTIYEYHKIDMLKKNISSNTALYLKALPTCISYKDCNSCLSVHRDIDCVWCKAVNRCSSGIDRLRQSWITNGCSLQVDATCPPSPPSTTTDASKLVTSFDKGYSVVETSTNHLDKSSDAKHFSTYDIDFPSKGEVKEAAHYMQEETETSSSSMSIGAIVTIVVFVVVLLGASGWTFYAYRFPQTRSGQFLIKYRPTQWTLRKDDNSSSLSSRHLGSS
ncbi:plexin domain-containing protein 2 [Parasteatoda tepidariorum]|uniref:plexin domain-containing protein 2 n=1 Tax=Parasteatoda tepidariorum TaxID=114398 RepID=UPI001C727C50|nr:plexin domain-containing protein 2 [Parasteatoda tepidariorum]